MAKTSEINLNIWDDLSNELLVQLEKCKQNIKELSMKIELSNVDINKISKKNTNVTSQLIQIQENLDAMNSSDVRNAYDGALETQQRLFVMRGQVEKLQSDLASNQAIETLIKRVMSVIVGDAQKLHQPKSNAPTVETVEMIIQAQEAERQRLSRQMHDGPAQALSNFILQTEIAMRLFDLDQDKAKEELQAIKTSATRAFQQVRDFIFELRPMMLDDLGLGPTIKKYVDAFKTHPGIEIQLNIPGIDRRLEPYLEVLAFRSIQELMGNAIRHSQATRILIQMELADKLLKVMVDDNGKGFDTGALKESGNMGIRVIRDRVEMLGGDFEIASVLDKGTRITFDIPIQ